MSDMVERVRGAIDDVQLWKRCNDLHFQPPMWEVCRYGSGDEAEIVVLSQSRVEPNLSTIVSEARARAAIEAMREMTDDMVEVAWETRMADPQGWWSDIIDAALKGEAE